MSDTPLDPDEVLALADRFFDAIERNDQAALREIYAPDVTVWHNHDRHAQEIDLNLKVLGWMHRKMPDKRYEEVRRQPTPTGFVEQHVLRATAPSGEQVDVPACLVVTVRDGRIARVEEYVDSAHIAAIV